MAGKFFSVDLAVLSKLLVHFRQEEWVEPVTAYLVLCKHQQRGQPFTTAGAPAIAKSLSITRYSAEKLLKALGAVQWGEEYHERAIISHQVLKDHPEIGIRPSIGLFSVKGLPRISDECMYLPNSLVEGKTDNPSPLCRLNAIRSPSARFDALSLLVHCYPYHDITGSGGLDPRKTFYRPWCDEGLRLEGNLALGYKGLRKESRETWHFWLVAPAKHRMAMDSFIEIVTEGNLDRFFQAVEHIKNFGFLFEVAMVFDRNPLGSLAAKPLYPLRVYDELYRNTAKELRTGTGGLYAETYNCLDRSGVMEHHVSDFRKTTFFPYKYHGEPSGFYVAAALMETISVLTVFRLRFCPHDRDAGVGFRVEAERAAAWKNDLSRAFCSHY